MKGLVLSRSSGLEVRMCAIEKIISGGQTGADQGGLEAGKALGLMTGGTAPPRFITEVGSCKRLLESFGLVEGKRDPRIYPLRTEANVFNSDGTVVFGVVSSAGSRLTLQMCRQYKRPWFLVTTPESHDELTIKAFWVWLEDNEVSVLNVAGNRESKGRGLQERVRLFLVAALKGN